MSTSIEIGSTAEALSYLYELSLNQSSLCFRGQADFGWAVQPSIYRFSNFSRFQTVQFERFLLNSKPPKPSPPLTHTEFDLEWLMVSQHYGMPTRLLDWTSDILIGLYFACAGKENLDKDGALFICDQGDYPSYNAYDEDAMISQELSFVNTNVINPRMRLQSGSFMMWGHRPLDRTDVESYDLWEYHKSKEEDFLVQKIKIKPRKKEPILEELSKIYAISHDNLYLEDGFLERKYLDTFQKVKEKLRLMTLYVTDAEKLSKEEEEKAMSLFQHKCRNMYKGCKSLRLIA